MPRELRLRHVSSATQIVEEAAITEGEEEDHPEVTIVMTKREVKRKNLLRQRRRLPIKRRKSQLIRRNPRPK